MTNLALSFIKNNTITNSWNLFDLKVFFYTEQVDIKKFDASQYYFEPSKPNGKATKEEQQKYEQLLASFKVNKAKFYTEANNELQTIISNLYYIDICSAFQIFPLQTFMPVVSSFTGKTNMMLNTNISFSGRIGLNTTVDKLISVFKKLLLSKTPTFNAYKNKDYTIYIPTIIVYFLNPIKFLHVSYAIITDAVLTPTAFEFSLSSYPLQSEFKFILENLLYLDIPFDILKNNILLITLQGLKDDETKETKTEPKK